MLARVSKFVHFCRFKTLMCSGENVPVLWWEPSDYFGSSPNNGQSSDWEIQAGTMENRSAVLAIAFGLLESA